MPGTFDGSAFPSPRRWKCACWTFLSIRHGPGGDARFVSGKRCDATRDAPCRSPGGQECLRPASKCKVRYSNLQQHEVNACLAWFGIVIRSQKLTQWLSYGILSLLNSGACIGAALVNRDIMDGSSSRLAALTCTRDHSQDCKD